MTDEDIDHLAGLGYARDVAQALKLVESARIRRRVLHGADPGRARPGGRRRRREHAPEVDLLLPQGPDRAAVQPAVRVAAKSSATIRVSSGVLETQGQTPMKATARRTSQTAFTHRIDIRSISSRPTSRPSTAATTRGPARRSCSPRASPRAPRSRWRCTPSARAGTSARSRSSVEYSPAERGCPTKFRHRHAAAERLQRGAGRAASGDRRRSAPCTATLEARSCSRTSVSS